MGELQNPHFYDFGIFERVPGSPNQLCLFLETPGYLTKIKKNLGLKKNSEIHVLKCSEKTAPKNPEDSSNKVLENWIRDHYLSKNIKWRFSKPRYFETRKPRNFETKKL